MARRGYVSFFVDIPRGRAPQVELPRAVARCSANALVFLRAARCLAAADRAGGIVLLDLGSLSVSK